VNEAQAFLNRGEIVARGRAIARAQAIVLELASSLDPAKGGSSSEELVGRLRLLYDYLLSKLATAHASQDANALEEAQALLEDLHNGWRLIRPQSQTGSIDQLPEPQPVDLCA
jgi:flagellar protein FliS